MDTTVTLQTICELGYELQGIDMVDGIGCVDMDKVAEFESLAYQLLGQVEALHKELSRGGFLPAQWSEARAL